MAFHACQLVRRFSAIPPRSPPSFPRCFSADFIPLLTPSPLFSQTHLTLRLKRSGRTLLLASPLKAGRKNDISQIPSSHVLCSSPHHSMPMGQYSACHSARHRQAFTPHPFNYPLSLCYTSVPCFIFLLSFTQHSPPHALHDSRRLLVLSLSLSLSLVTLLLPPRPLLPHYVTRRVR